MTMKMLGPVLRSRAVVTASVLSAAAFGVSACSSQSSTTAAGSASTATPASQMTSGGASSTGMASAAPSVTTSGVGTPSTGGTNPDSAPACANGDLKTTVGTGGGGAMSHDGFVLIFTNTSSHPCKLTGYPGASIVKGSTVLVAATRTLSGYLGDGGKPLTTPMLVTLAPGSAASATLEWVDDAGEKCYANGVGTLEVTAPNTTDTVSLQSMTVGSQGVCAGFEVHPVVAGIISS